jgi:hypothetical protein
VLGLNLVSDTVIDNVADLTRRKSKNAMVRFV